MRRDVEAAAPPSERHHHKTTDAFAEELLEKEKREERTWVLIQSGCISIIIVGVFWTTSSLQGHGDGAEASHRQAHPCSRALWEHYEGISYYQKPSMACPDRVSAPSSTG